MKKIGIVTFWTSKDNYGQIMQCFALNYFLRKIGYDSYLIKDKVDKKSSCSIFFRILFYLFHPQKLIQAIAFKNKAKKNLKRDCVHPRNFESFRNKYIPSTKEYFHSELFNAPPKFDAYVCGSDQIWHDLSPIYYLKFAPSASKKIAYAASMGSFYPSGKDLLLFRQFIADFNIISLREKSSVNYLANQNIQNIFFVPDPVLLLKAEEYRLISEKASKKRAPYILLYFVGNKCDFDIKKVFTYANEKKLDVVYVASQWQFDNYPKEYPSVEEWLQLIDDAEFVVTNSFHGTMFSIIFHKKFVVIPLSGVDAASNNRIHDSLARYGLLNHIYNGSLEKYNYTPDYTFFDLTIETEIHRVKQMFVEAIDDPKSQCK